MPRKRWDLMSLRTNTKTKSSPKVSKPSKKDGYVTLNSFRKMSTDSRLSTQRYHKLTEPITQLLSSLRSTNVRTGMWSILDMPDLRLLRSYSSDLILMIDFIASRLESSRLHTSKHSSISSMKKCKDVAKSSRSPKSKGAQTKAKKRVS